MRLISSDEVTAELFTICVAESQIRLALVDFLRGLVEFDPAKRWSPFQVLNNLRFFRFPSYELLYF